MGFLAFFNHLLNFCAPAVAVGTLVALLGPRLARSGQPPRTWLRQSARNAAFGVFALLLGLWFFGHDGKIASYTAMLMAIASCQWWAGRGR